MCVDLKNKNQFQPCSSQQNALLAIVGIVLVVALFVWTAVLTPRAVDQMLGVSPEQSRALIAAEALSK